MHYHSSSLCGTYMWRPGHSEHTLGLGTPVALVTGTVTSQGPEPLYTPPPFHISLQSACSLQQERLYMLHLCRLHLCICSIYWYVCSIYVFLYAFIYVCKHTSMNCHELQTRCTGQWKPWHFRTIFTDIFQWKCCV